MRQGGLENTVTGQGVVLPSYHCTQDRAHQRQERGWAEVGRLDVELVMAKGQGD